MKPANILVLSLGLAVAATACSNLPSALRPYKDQAPKELLKAVDEQVYSPVEEGLKSLEAVIEVDVSGFFPSDARPNEPVWVPVKFLWKGGESQFVTGKWPKKLTPLQDRLLDFLSGKGDDLIRRSFTEVLEGYNLSLNTTKESRLAINAVLSDNTDRKITLEVDERLLIPSMRLKSEQADVLSKFEYDNATPAHVTRITSEFSGNGQKTTVTARFDYGSFDGYVLPNDVVYTIEVGAKKLPPFRMRVKDYKAE